MAISPILPVYRRSGITMVRGDGCYLYDDAGEEYLDFATGIGVNALGHNHPQLVDALKAQAETLWHCSNLYMHAGLQELAERIVADTFADTVFFCSTGTEAVECALKMARRYHYMNDERNKMKDEGSASPISHRSSSHLSSTKWRTITFTGGFHGRSFAGISAGGNEVARAGYHPLLDGFDCVAFNDIEAVKAAITDETAAILIEPIQGEGGFVEAEDSFLQALRALADEHGLLLICDEVQCGLGRSGELFAHQKSGIRPDIVCIAKAIGNGFPLAATLATANAASGMTPGTHGSTYGANPLAIAVASKVWGILTENKMAEHVSNVAKELDAALAALQQSYPNIIAGLRGRALMRGLLIAEDSPKNHYEIAELLRSAGLLTAPAAGDRVIRLLPPLIIEPQHIEQAKEILETTLNKL